MKKLLYILLMLVAISTVSAWDSTNMSNKLLLYTPFNNTLTDYGENTFTVNVDLCLQESANVTTACGGINNGTYNITSTDFGAYAFGYVDINYTKPLGVQEIKWQVYQNLTYSNITFNSSSNASCYTAYDNKIVLRLRSADTFGGTQYLDSWCYNSTAWHFLRTLNIGGDAAEGASDFNNIIDGSYTTFARINDDAEWVENAATHGGAVSEEAVYYTIENYTTDYVGISNKAIFMNEYNSGRITDNTILEPKNFTVSFWAYPNSHGGGNGGVVYHKEGTGGVYLYATPTNWSSIIGTTTVTGSPKTLNVWQHIVMTYDGTNVTHYRDGIKYISKASSNPSYGADPVLIGNRDDLTRGYNGVLDELRVYNRTLDNWEILNLYNVYDDLGYNVTSNISSYTSNIVENIKVQVNYSGFSNSVTCGVEDNSSNVSCNTQLGSAGTSIITCDITRSTVHQFPYFQPYCTNGTKVYSESFVGDIFYSGSINFTIIDSETDLVVTDNITLDLYNSVANYSNSTTLDFGYINFTGVPFGSLRVIASGAAWDTNTIYFDMGTAIDYSTILYVTNSSSDDIKDVTLHVQDDAEDELENALIFVYAQNSTTGSFNLVSKEFTNLNGETLVQLVKDTIYYRFIIQYEGETCYTTENPFTITALDDDLYFICLIEDDYIEFRDAYNDINITLDEVNTSNLTGYFTMHGNADAITEFCLKITRRVGGVETIVNRTCQSTTDSTITINVDATGQTKDTAFRADAQYKPNGQTQYDIKDSKHLLFDIVSRPALGNVGLFVAILILCTVIWITQSHPVVLSFSIGVTYFGLTLFHIIDVPYLNANAEIGSGILLLIMSIIISYLLSKRGGE